ncbi:hypothetical protein ABEF95_007514 [Exophiala dermatitidis]
MVELRKRPPPKEPATPAPAAKAKRGAGSGSSGSASTVKNLADKAKEVVSSVTETATAAVSEDKTTTTEGAEGSAATSTADKKTSVAIEGTGPVNIDGGFGGSIHLHDGTETTLRQLLDKSEKGVVLFTYPRASTPGCTTQVCLFRDNYDTIRTAGFSVFGLSTDSPKANTTFATKQKLPYQLLCDPGATLTTAIGMKKPGPGKSTARGVVVIEKADGERVTVWEQAGPAKTLDAVLEHIKTLGDSSAGEKSHEEPAATDKEPPAIQESVATDKVVPAIQEPVDSKETTTKLADPDTKMDEVPLIKTPSREEQEAATTAAEVGETAAKIDAAVGELKE